MYIKLNNMYLRMHEHKQNREKTRQIQNSVYKYMYVSTIVCSLLFAQSQTHRLARVTDILYTNMYLYGIYNENSKHNNNNNNIHPNSSPCSICHCPQTVSS